MSYCRYLARAYLAKNAVSILASILNTMKEYLVRERLHDNLLEHLMLARGVCPGGVCRLFRARLRGAQPRPFCFARYGGCGRPHCVCDTKQRAVCVVERLRRRRRAGRRVLAEFFARHGA